jgi:hypothetical protein
VCKDFFVRERAQKIQACFGSNHVAISAQGQQLKNITKDF